MENQLSALTDEEVWFRFWSEWLQCVFPLCRCVCRPGSRIYRSSRVKRLVWISWSCSCRVWLLKLRYSSTSSSSSSSHSVTHRSSRICWRQDRLVRCFAGGSVETRSRSLTFINTSCCCQVIFLLTLLFTLHSQLQFGCRSALFVLHTDNRCETLWPV